MAGKLVTIATFDQAAQAWVAENVLKDAGIKAAVSDETLVAMDWLMSGVVGGVKVQVLEEDADRAVAVLENQFGENGEGLGGAVPPEELATQAEAAVIDDGEEQPVRPAPGSALEPEDGPLDPNGREEYARRLAFTAILVLVFVPLWFYYPIISFGFFPVAFYGMYLTLNATFGPGELSGRGRLNIGIGVAMILLTLLWFILLSNVLFS